MGHYLNLITQSACRASHLINDALQRVHELETLSKQSGKFKYIFALSSEGPLKSLRPLCPTRWTVRGKATRAVLPHEHVLSRSEEMTSSGSPTGMTTDVL